MSPIEYEMDFTSIPRRKGFINLLPESVLGGAAIELNLSGNQLVLEQKQWEKAEEFNVTNQVHIYDPNTGPIQQNGKNNTQYVIINAEFNAKIQQLRGASNN